VTDKERVLIALLITVVTAFISYRVDDINDELSRLKGRVTELEKPS
jgi:hypothetical protein